MHVDQLLGIQDAIGHKDFYPNGGAVQPGFLSYKFAYGKILFYFFFLIRLLYWKEKERDGWTIIQLR